MLRVLSHAVLMFAGALLISSLSHPFLPTVTELGFPFLCATCQALQLLLRFLPDFSIEGSSGASLQHFLAPSGQFGSKESLYALRALIKFENVLFLQFPAILRSIHDLSRVRNSYSIIHQTPSSFHQVAP